MAAPDIKVAPTEAPPLPEYLLCPSDLLKDDSANWRYG
jgi:hypothetical protein